MPILPRGAEPAQVVVTGDFVVLGDSNGEIVAWNESEWREDPSIVPAIINAVRVGLAEGGPALRLLVGSSSERRVCSVCDAFVALSDRRSHLEGHDEKAVDMTAEEVIDMYSKG